MMAIRMGLTLRLRPMSLATELVVHPFGQLDKTFCAGAHKSHIGLLWRQMQQITPDLAFIVTLPRRLIKSSSKNNGIARIELEAIPKTPRKPMLRGAGSLCSLSDLDTKPTSIRPR